MSKEMIDTHTRNVVIGRCDNCRYLDEFKSRLKLIRCNAFVDKSEIEFYKDTSYIGHPLAQAVEENCNYILQEVYKKAAAEMAEFIIKNDLIECETVETEFGTEYRLRLTVWAEPKED